MFQSRVLEPLSNWRHKRHLRFVTCFISALLCSVSSAWQDTKPGQDILPELKQRRLAAESDKRSVVQGKNGWMFFTPELRALTIGPFWGDESKQTSRASNLQFSDPLAPILDFSAQLDRAGITLLLVPVPAKVSIYPESFVESNSFKLESRLDIHHAEFYRLLREQGLDVLDLTDVFLREKRNSPKALYCQTDSHWSGRGIEVAADKIAERVRREKWYRPGQNLTWQTKAHECRFLGDLGLLIDHKRQTPEIVQLQQISVGNRDGLALTTEDADSPLLLLGDSHTLIFHDAALHATGCGLADHLALRLGMAIDLIGVRGSGANSARINWRRRAVPFAGKKYVVWCFSMREFTENPDGWRMIPMSKP